MPHKRTILTLSAAFVTGLAVTTAPAAAGAAAIGAGPAPGGAVPLAVGLPNVPGVRTASAGPNTACTLPDGSSINFFHCYDPGQIRSAFGVDQIASMGDGSPNLGQGQTIVLVDAYGSPTAANDLREFHDTFFPNLPNPNFRQIFPNGNPQYHNTAHGSGQSGPNAAAGWSGEATLDIEWAYAIAPLADIVLLAVPPAETLGVQGFPTLFRAISNEIAATPRGTVFSMSFAVTEQTFGGAAAVQTARFDAVFRQGLAKDDNFFAATGDTGSLGSAKQHHRSAGYPFPTAQWPASSPYVVAVGGTQLQDGWTWDPTSNAAFNPDGSLNPAYWNSTPGGTNQVVWNESWGPIGGGGGASAVYPRPAWQSGVDASYGNHRLIPDTSWNAAVNGGVDLYITAYPEDNCGNATGCWTVIGGTSAATPQTAALVALVNAARHDQHEAPVGFLDPLLYSGVGTSAYTDVTPAHQGSAPKTFDGTEVGVAGAVPKSVGDLVDNQMWQVPVAGYPVTAGYDAATGWGDPWAPTFVQELVGP